MERKTMKVRAAIFYLFLGLLVVSLVIALDYCAKDNAPPRCRCPCPTLQGP
jgi:hypothetical protein